MAITLRGIVEAGDIKMISGKFDLEMDVWLIAIHNEIMNQKEENPKGIFFLALSKMVGRIEKSHVEKCKSKLQGVS